MEENKILITALGKGNIKEAGTNDSVNANVSPETMIEKLTNGEYRYNLAKYSYEVEEGEREKAPIESPFISTVLIAKYQPHTVVVVGTASSMWSEFYHKLCLLPDKKELEDYQYDTWKELMIYEKAGNRSTNDCDLNKEQEYINSAFETLCKKNSDLPNIKALLTRYGLDKLELKDNYERVKGLKTLFRKEAINKVAIDITHSFRSLSIYNLALVNYIQSLSECSVVIERVFYGNLDVSRENNNIAPILDLSMLIEAISLANGIIEFKNTGNAVTICKSINAASPNDNFIDIVQKFDWATQTNNLKDIKQYLDAILTYCFSAEEKNSSLLYDAKYAIQNSLSSAFGCVTLDDADLQLKLAEWSLKQNRVGLASAIAKEALRSFLVKKYADIEHRSISLENENERKRSEQLFRICANQKDNSHIFKTFLTKEDQAVSIRNAFAHNLKNVHNYSDAKNITKEYVECIKRIMETGDSEFYLISSSSVGADPNKRQYIVISKKKGDALSTFAQKAISSTANSDEIELWVIEDGKHRTINWDLGTNPRTKKQKIIKIARIISEKIKTEFSNQTNISLYWDSDLDVRIGLNAGTLIKSWMKARNGNCNFYWLADSGSRSTLYLPYWDISGETTENDIRTEQDYINAVCYRVPVLSTTS